MSAEARARILVVDDDPFFVRVLEKRFGAEGYQVRTATNGRDGMREIVAWEPHLVISDWMMPEVDGLELCQSVKTGLRDAAPYFILLTAKGELSDRLLGLETGADDYLVKPCDHAELMARVRAGLRIVRLTSELRRAVEDLKALGRGGAGDGETRGNGGGDGAEGGGTSDALDDGTAAAGPVPPPGAAPAGWCPRCRRVRGEDGAWRTVEDWLEGHVARRESCPDCPPREGRAAA